MISPLGASTRVAAPAAASTCLSRIAHRALLVLVLVLVLVARCSLLVATARRLSPRSADDRPTHLAARVTTSAGRSAHDRGGRARRGCDEMRLPGRRAWLRKLDWPRDELGRGTEGRNADERNRSSMHELPATRPSRRRSRRLRSARTSHAPNHGRRPDSSCTRRSRARCVPRPCRRRHNRPLLAHRRASARALR